MAKARGLSVASTGLRPPISTVIERGPLMATTDSRRRLIRDNDGQAIFRPCPTIARTGSSWFT
jgi:hypothetical protein